MILDFQDKKPSHGEIANENTKAILELYESHNRMVTQIRSVQNQLLGLINMTQILDFKNKKPSHGEIANENTKAILELYDSHNRMVTQIRSAQNQLLGSMYYLELDVTKLTEIIRDHGKRNEMLEKLIEAEKLIMTQENENNKPTGVPDEVPADAGSDIPTDGSQE